ncbi:uncharacterized protein [Palaemon carinicauda]|uniref:uncharacterized protein n=1 Tax=Palaemon carinicauda TaxID=392227 RepID=UPI0035B59DCB
MTLYFLVHAGAVSFGFLDEIEREEVVCLAMTLAQDSRWQRLRYHQCIVRRGMPPPPLPDIVVSNTPPESPIRSAPSSTCLYFAFPEPHKSSKVLCEGHHHRGHHPSPSGGEGGLPTPPSTPSSVGGTPNSLLRLRPRRLQCPRHYQYNHCFGRSPSEGYPPRRCLQILRREGGAPCLQCLQFTRAREERLRWRSVGEDLRRLADHFHEVNSETDRKLEANWLTLSLLVPVALTRCLSASVLCLIRWRLFDRLQ